jgi:hypothetical protein
MAMVVMINDYMNFRTSMNVKQKVTLSLYRHGGANGENYSAYSSLISSLDEGEWSASRPGRALLPRKGPPVPIG